MTRTRAARTRAPRGTAASPRPLPSPPPQVLRRWQRPGGVADTDPYAPDSVALYRFFNVPGALLYVGITGNPKLRFGQHVADKTWWHDVASWTVEWHPDRATADEAETRAIRDEVPAYNIAKVPAPEDERDVHGEWVATFRRRPPCKEDLDNLFLQLVRLESLGRRPGMRLAWTKDQALDMYVYAKDGAGRVDVREHQRFIEGWNAEQEVAWRRHRGDPDPVLLPVWPQTESIRERIALRLLGRRDTTPREVPLSQTRRAIAIRERAARSDVKCLRTGVLIGRCDCCFRHVIDARDERLFGRPAGTPIGPRNKHSKVVDGAVA